MMSTKEKVLQAMRSRFGDKFRSVGNDSWQSCSPYRNGDNETAFLLTIEKDELGGFKDFVTGQRGSLYDLAAHLGVGTPSANGSGAPSAIDKTGMDKAPSDPPAPPVKKDIRSFATLAEYAAHQGAPVEAFEKARVHVIQWKRMGKKFQDKEKTPHLAFPHGDGVNRLRRMVGGLKPKWFPQKGGITPILYGWKRALQIRGELGGNEPLILTNGQPSVIVAQHNGLAAFCLTDGENKPIPESQLAIIKVQLNQGNILYIAKDNDDAGELGTKAVLTQLWQYGAQIKTIKFKGAPGYDLANHCKAHGDKSLDELIKLEITIPMNPAEETVKELSKSVGQLSNLMRQKEGDEAIQLELQSLRKKMEQLDANHMIIEVVEDAFQEPYELFNQRMQTPRAITGLRCGIDQIDYAISGFNKRAAHRLLASTSAGKSLLMAGFAYSFGRQARGVVVSYESGSMEFVFRMVAVETRLPFGNIMKAGQLIETGGTFKFQQFNDEQSGKVRRSFQNLGKWNRLGRFNFPKKAPGTPRALYTFMGKCKNQFGIEWAIIDSLNNISVPGAGQHESMAMAAINSESMAVDFDLAIIDTVQGGRATKGRDDKKLGISDGKWSSEIEEKAHVHMSLYNHWVHVARGEADDTNDNEALYPRNSAELTINKARGSGMVGRKITMKYEPGAGFYNYDRR